MTLHRSPLQTLRRVVGATGLFFTTLVIAASVVPPAYAQVTTHLAQQDATRQLPEDRKAGTTTTTPPPAAAKTELYDPLNHATITTLVGRATLGFMGLSGTGALLFFVYGGFKMITAGGNEKKYTEGLNSLKWAVIGLLVIFGSYALLTTFLNALGSAAS